MRKLRFEILLGTVLLGLSVLSIVWVYSMVCTASEIGIMERQDVKQWSSVLILLSVMTLFIGSVGGYIIGKYLHVPMSNPNLQAVHSRDANEEAAWQICVAVTQLGQYVRTIICEFWKPRLNPRMIQRRASLLSQHRISRSLNSYL